MIETQAPAPLSNYRRIARYLCTVWPETGRTRIKCHLTLRETEFANLDQLHGAIASGEGSRDADYRKAMRWCERAHRHMPEPRPEWQP